MNGDARVAEDSLPVEHTVEHVVEHVAEIGLAPDPTRWYAVRTRSRHEKLVARQLAVPDLDRRWVGQAGRELAALEGQRGRAFPAVPAGAFNEQRGPAREL